MRVLSNLIPEKCLVACSGGADSIALAWFLGRHHINEPLVTKRVQGLLFIDHNTSFSKECISFVRCFAKKLHTRFYYAIIASHKTKSSSLEQHWSNERRDIYASQTIPIVTGHHLDDAAEQLFMSALHGSQRIIGNEVTVINHKTDCTNIVSRPLLDTTKASIITFCKKHQLSYKDDPSNHNIQFLRNECREIMLHYPRIAQYFRARARRLNYID